MSIDVSDYNFFRDIKKSNGSLSQPMCCSSQSLSDWAILNSTNARRLRLLLQDADSFAMPRIEQACRLVEAYHAVYRRDLLQLRRRKCVGQCPPPNSSQLQQMVESLNEKENLNYSASHVLMELRILARQLRAQRISSI